MRSRLAALESEVRYLSPENRQRYRTVRKGVEELVLEIVKEGKKRELFDVSDAAETTRALLGMCQSIPRWYHAEGKLTPDAVARKYVEIAMKTVGSTELPSHRRRGAPPACDRRCASAGSGGQLPRPSPGDATASNCVVVSAGVPFGGA